MKNAMAMAEAGAAKVLAESELNSQTLASAIDEILGYHLSQSLLTIPFPLSILSFSFTICF
jgi:hypothetical protein